MPDKLRWAIEKTLGSENLEKHWRALRECVYDRELVTVFDYHSTLEIDVAILKGLLKGMLLVHAMHCFYFKKM